MPRRESGFSIVELMIAMGIMMVVTGAMFTMLNPAQGTYAAQPEVSDMQQRLRVAQDNLARDLILAGAGPFLAPPDITFSTLSYYFPPVLPYRQTPVGGDPQGSFFDNRITLFYVPTTTAETTLRNDFKPVGVGPGSTLEVNRVPGCAANKNLCGFILNNAGITTTVLVVDGDTGNYDTFSLTADADEQLLTIPVSAPQHAVGTTYARGSKVIEVRQRTYSMEPDKLSPGAFQLVTYDTTADVNLPVVDHVVDLKFKYYGDPQPPQFRKAGDPASVTYGPPPSAVAVPPGNCLFADAMGTPLLPVLANGANPNTLIELAKPDLTNGPWCPGPANANRWDADLLRIRKIGVTIRVESAVDALRGPLGPLFNRAGTAKGGERFVPDQEIHFEIAPRNLNLGR